MTTTSVSPNPGPSLAVSNFWLMPLGYAHSAVALVGLWVLGFALQWVVGGLHAPVWPVSLYTFAIVTAMCVACFLLFKQRPLVAWLGGVPFALTALGALILLATVAGIVPQDAQYELPDVFRRLGMNQMLSSWPFVFTLLALVFNLGLASLKHMVGPWSLSRVIFLLNHLGLYLIIACALFGAGDVTRVRFMVPESQFEPMAFDTEGRAHVMPFGLYLKQFSLEEYPPTLMLASTMTGESLWEKGDPIIEAKPGQQAFLTHNAFKVQVKIRQYYPHGRVVQQKGGLGYIPSKRASDPPVCLVEARNLNASKPAVATGWVTRGGPMSLPQVLRVGDLSVEMSQARPKRFMSDALLVKPSDKSVRPIRLEVNHPYWVDGWALYQHSYEQAIGSGVSVSVIEAVRDRWIVGVYAGIFMMLAACGLMLVFGNARKGARP